MGIGTKGSRVSSSAYYCLKTAIRTAESEILIGSTLPPNDPLVSYEHTLTAQERISSSDCIRTFRNQTPTPAAGAHRHPHGIDSQPDCSRIKQTSAFCGSHCVRRLALPAWMAAPLRSINVYSLFIHHLRNAFMLPKSARDGGKIEIGLL